MALVAPAPRDPTLLRLGRRLSPDEVMHYQARTDTEATRQLLLAGPSDLAWAVRIDESGYRRKWEQGVVRVMRLKEAVWEDGRVIFSYNGTQFWDSIDRIVRNAWPMIGYRVDKGWGWLKPMMKAELGLRIRRPFEHNNLDYGYASSEFALANPVFNWRKHRDEEFECPGLYALVFDREREDNRKAKKKTEEEENTVGVRDWRNRSWRFVDLQNIYKSGKVQVVHSEPHRRFYMKKDKFRYRLRYIQEIPRDLVNRVNMQRMTLIFYCVRFEVPLERDTSDPNRPIKRWNPFYFLGLDLCVMIAQELDCCDDNGVLLDKYARKGARN